MKMGKSRRKQRIWLGLSSKTYTVRLHEPTRSMCAVCLIGSIWGTSKYVGVGPTMKVATRGQQREAE